MICYVFEKYLTYTSTHQHIDLLWVIDKYSQTALEVARQRECLVAERILIYASLRRKSPVQISAKV